MSEVINIHPENPQQRLIKRVIDFLKKGSIVAYPTDSGYALGFTLGNKKAMNQVINIRKLNKQHHFTLMLRNLSQVGEYAKLNNASFRLMKKILPGAYTFILEGSKKVPNRLLNGKNKTIGIRVSTSPLVQSILEGLLEPMMSTSLIIDGYDFYNFDDVKIGLNGEIDLLVDGGYCPPEPTTVIDLSSENVVILREGAGSIDFLV
jgi:tRNA threonylcarbamoyl adenosine modification protein (Sua5/YciO/YrdC/YwlC family)